MIDEIRKSINSNLYERTRSPLYGTLIISWCIWNWKLIYFIFTSSLYTPFNERIRIIQEDLTTNWTLFLGPIISTILILTLFEFIANYAYWLSIYYKTWRTNKKVKTEGKQLLTYEQSLNLRNDIRQKEEQYEKLIQEKENEIKILKDSIASLNTSTKADSSKSIVKKSIDDQMLEKLVSENLIPEFKEYCSLARNKRAINEDSKNLQYFVSLGLLEKGQTVVSGVSYKYNLTPLGTGVYDKAIFR